MAGNKNLNSAKTARKDEFYTQLTDIEKEMRYYRKHFKDKTVLCNCDDPFESNFFKYFVLNFNRLGLKKLIATCYTGSPIANKQLSIFDILGESEETQNKPYKAVVTTVYDKTGDGGVDMLDVAELFKSGENELTELKGDGDFRSPECLELLDESDIVVTNPPFSLFKEYVAVLVEHKKSYIIIGNMNAIKYKEIFPLFMNNEMWLGASIHSGDRAFFVPDDYPLKAAGCGIDEATGRKYIRVKGVRWFTNLDIKQRHEEMILVRRYDPEANPKYDNYDAIDVSSANDIPGDYAGLMGVPISFLDKYNPEQFDLLGISDLPNTMPGIEILGEDWIAAYRKQGGTGHYTANMRSLGLSAYGRHKVVFSRLIIRNKHPEEPKGAVNHAD
ncbi:MAG: adenine-specific methyltransferase EcoRI family protein [Clostridia bacterium]|nr:adenine-specific methyltransferase EcoRI family protein [Clostridia bacterium]MBO6270510.1 adenine-specific methyltransferase EcoRI family protein [Clostridium sp.]MBP3901786.1 adenine-specific methyltransferase EcoRI family protein [Blautia sp.]